MGRNLGTVANSVDALAKWVRACLRANAKRAEREAREAEAARKAGKSRFWPD